MSNLQKPEVGVLLTTLAVLLGLKSAQPEIILEPKHIIELRAIDEELAALLEE